MCVQICTSKHNGTYEQKQFNMNDLKSLEYESIEKRETFESYEIMIESSLII